MNIKTIPKIELHCHLEGILDPAMARVIAEDEPDFPVDLAALTAVYPVEGYEAFWAWFQHTRPLFQQPRFLRPVIAQHIEIHAGEWCGPESVWDALDFGYPDRLGHGVALFQDPRLIETIVERGIHIEMCPTSNVKTGSIGRLEDHPIVRAKELGLNFSVNTDDPGCFSCSMESEYALLVDLFDFTAEDFEDIYEHANAARFQQY